MDFVYVGTILLGQSGNQDRSVMHMVVCRVLEVVKKHYDLLIINM